MDTIRVLLVEDDPDDYCITRDLLADIEGVRYELVWEPTFEGGLRVLDEGAVDVALVDYRLGGRTGIELLRETMERTEPVPVILLTGLSDRATDVEAMRCGASDYLVKGEVDGRTLERSIRYAIRQNRLMIEIRALSLVDELTGLYNRRGFQTLAEQQLRIATRMRRDLVILFADVDGLKRINDELGHAAGDEVIREMGGLLRATFRESDTVARLGGDEFAVLVWDASESAVETFLTRLQGNLERRNEAQHPLYRFGISVGTVERRPEDARTLESMVAEADQRMYLDKRDRRAAAAPWEDDRRAGVVVPALGGEG